MLLVVRYIYLNVITNSMPTLSVSLSGETYRAVSEIADTLGERKMSAAIAMLLKAGLTLRPFDEAVAALMKADKSSYEAAVGKIVSAGVEATKPTPPSDA